MTNRFMQALRVLLGKPLDLHAVDGTMLLDASQVSDCDFTKQPPFDLAFAGWTANGPPEHVVRREGFRICVFPETNGDVCECCGGHCHWRVFELKDRGRWYHLFTMHDSKLPYLKDALDDLGIREALAYDRREPASRPVEE